MPRFPHSTRWRRPSIAVIGTAILMLGALTVYLALEVVRLPLDRDLNRPNLEKVEVKDLEVRLHRLEEALRVNRETLNKLVDTVDRLHGQDENLYISSQDGFNQQKWSDKFMVSVGNSNWSASLSPICHNSEEGEAQTDIQMLKLYENLDFSNVDGGVWKQGWPITYEESQWSPENKLQVFVVPHSHNDPGWLKTFEKYYLDHTQHIFNNMIAKLGEDNRRRFIWAEISFMSMWWDKADESKRAILKRYLEQNQLEIVTGGWVMNDEAVTHYFSMIDQLIEGHEWIQNHLGYFPENGWAIDPFGLSPTMAYLLKRMGLNHMLIQRVHYSVKKHFSKEKSLEFYWRQLWDTKNATDIFCHMMPFYSYDVPHTCGPNPEVCCQFDFKRLPGGKVNCPWRISPQPINDKNVAQRAQLLLDQYRKKSQLYRTNVVLIPLGDDFRYDKAIEWDQQYSNYQRLFDYMNSNSKLNVHAQFGTLHDYFTAVEADHLRRNSLSLPDNTFPSVSGDFFSYADRDDHYWSGYYTSRPFYKNLDRSLESYLRAGDIIFSLALAHASSKGMVELSLAKDLLPRLSFTRRNLGLFQHHDGITGTSKDPVVIDYGNRLLQGIHEMQRVIGQSAAFLLSPDTTPYASDFQPVAFDLDDHKSSHFSLPRKTLIEIPREGRSVAFYNSLGQQRQQMVSLVVSSSTVCVQDGNGITIPAQLNPLWDTESISMDQYEIIFTVDVPALGLALYKLIPAGLLAPKGCLSYSSVKLHNAVNMPNSHPIFQVKEGSSSSFNISNSHLVATFTEEGLLKGINTKQENISIQVVLKFLKYGTRNQKDKSGAYLFLPDESATPIAFQKPYFRVIEGPLLSEVQVFLPHVAHRVQLKNSPGIDGLGIDIVNVVDISTELNKELVMRFETNVKSDDEFYTDLNGFQITKRKKFENLPLQAHFYPVATMAYIQDQQTRFTLLTGQPLGGSSLESGWLEVVMDRRLNQDDNRGLQQGVLDNKRTLSSFRILVEKRIGNLNALSALSYPSLVANLASQTLLHPVFRLIATATSPGAPLPPLKSIYQPLAHDFPCDIHMLNLRTMLKEYDGDPKTFTMKNSTALLLHRLGIDCHISTPELNCQLGNGSILLGNHLLDYYQDNLVSTTLSLLYDKEHFSKSQSKQQLSVMEIYAYKLFR